MRNKVKTTILLFIFSISLTAQGYKVDKENSQISITGTSNIHDWSAVVREYEFSGKVNSKSISDICFEVVVKSIKSGKSGMDKNIYKALKSDDFPKIEFKSKTLKIKGSEIIGKGTLTIAGQSKDINMSFEFIKRNHIYIVSGTIALKMTDYGVDPPTTAFGIIKTRDEIKLEVLLSLKSENYIISNN
ncbi:MAG: YceI family protein [Bacteroidetes bacterium]|nr:YceI family protein [Bacteroidota bacterium]